MSEDVLAQPESRGGVGVADAQRERRDERGAAEVRSLRDSSLKLERDRWKTSVALV
jgi:hypothetical protein